MIDQIDQIIIDQIFCSRVWDALKGDHNDLRKQAIILEAHRDACARIRDQIDNPT